jgi:HEAT repeat protein
MKLSLAACVAGSLLALLPVHTRSGEDKLKSKDPLERLAAIEELGVERSESAAKSLAKLLDDADWEVMERAAEALGKVGGEKDADDLAKLALEGPVRRVRLVAARSAAALDADGVASGLLRKIRGDTAPAALDALAIVLPACAEPPPLRPLEALLRDKVGRLRAGAARALVLGARDDRPEVLKELLASERVMVRAAALEGAENSGDAALLAPLLEYLGSESVLDPLLERRARRAFVASVRAIADEAQRKEAALDAVGGLGGDAAAVKAARGPRLVRELVGTDLVAASALEERLAGALGHAHEGVRAQAAAVLGALGGESAAQRARELAATDPSARVRRAAATAALVVQGTDTPEGLPFALERLAIESEAAAREDLVVALGRRDLEGAREALVGALEDADWRVRVAAAVSLGKTRLEAARAPLEALYQNSAADWRMRGAAIAGLAHLYQSDAVPKVIGALDDEEPLVKRMAHGWLVAATGQDLAPESEPWREWWNAAGSRARLLDIQELDERQRRYGYDGVTMAEIYRGLDVQVLESRGDHIEKLLTHLDIPHNMTRAGIVRSSGPDPRGVFVANCTGEIEADDTETLEFFLHAGGYLFGSCWAVEETIARIAPGYVRRLATRDEVLDRVTAYPAAPASPYVEGVFAPGTVPLYELQGAYLIEVLAPERVEVLVDSPEAAERWGGGELAAWFRVGHGVVLDSVNHFDVQGLEMAQGLKKPVDRQAYAVDHMGLSYEALRDNRNESYWGNNHRAAQVIQDLSVFRLVTNFVRLRRLAGD